MRPLAFGEKGSQSRVEGVKGVAGVCWCVGKPDWPGQVTTKKDSCAWGGPNKGMIGKFSLRL